MFCGLVTAWRLATWPTRRSPAWAKPTTEGVVRAPSALAITLPSEPSMTETTLLVVPRSIPMILLILYNLLLLSPDRIPAKLVAICLPLNFLGDARP